MFSCKTERKTFPGRATWTKPLKSQDEKAQNKYKAAGCSPQCSSAVCLASLLVLLGKVEPFVAL